MVSDEHPQIPVEASGDRLKITCHSCGARYLVPAQRVRGRRFRVVCKHCDGIIVAHCDKGSFTVMPTGGGGVASTPDALRLESSELDEEDAPTLAVVPSSGGWYVGISGQPHGPFDVPEVESYLSRDKVGPRTWAWRVGAPTWRRLSEIEEFRDWFLNNQLTQFYAQDDARPEPRQESDPALGGTLLPQLSSEPQPAPAGNGQQQGGIRRCSSESDPTALACPRPAEAGALSSTMGLSQAGDEQHDEQVGQETAAEAATGSLPHVERWRRRTELGMAGACPGKLSDGAWEEVSESGVHDKRPQSARSWVVGAPSGDRQVWSARPRLKKTLPLAGASAVFDSQMAPLPDDGPQPTAALNAAGEERVSDEEAISGAKLSTELLQLIPAKMAGRPRQTMAPAQISFAPPLPDRALTMGAAGPSLMLKPKRRFWTTGKILAAALIGTAALMAMAVPLVSHFARPSENSKDVVEEMTPQPRARQSGSTPVAQRVEPSKASAAVRVDGSAKKRRERRSTVKRAKRRADAQSVAKRAGEATIRPKASAPRRSKRHRRRSARRKATKPRSSAETGQSAVVTTEAKSPTAEVPVDDSDLVSVGGAPAQQADPGTESEGETSSPDADAILAAGAVRRRSTTSLPKTLSKPRIKRVMSRFRSAVQACFDKHQNPGVLKLKVTVQPYGRAVGSAVGPLANTATAACTLQALPRLRFPRFAGEPVTFTYPYALK